MNLNTKQEKNVCIGTQNSQHRSWNDKIIDQTITISNNKIKSHEFFTLYIKITKFVKTSGVQVLTILSPAATEEAARHVIIWRQISHLLGNKEHDTSRDYTGNIFENKHQVSNFNNFDITWMLGAKTHWKWYCCERFLAKYRLDLFTPKLNTDVLKTI